MDVHVPDREVQVEHGARICRGVGWGCQHGHRMTRDALDDERVDSLGPCSKVAVAHPANFPGPTWR